MIHLKTLYDQMKTRTIRNRFNYFFHVFGVEEQYIKYIKQETQII